MDKMGIDKGKSSEKPFRWLEQLIMWGGYLLLLLEVRFEHREVVAQKWQAWIPIAYCALMLILIPLCMAIWNRGGRKLLIGFYSIGFPIGLVGAWLHSDGHIRSRLMEVLVVWQHLFGKIDPNQPFHPPFLAPLAFVGLALVGILLTSESGRLHDD
jgi:hypothetical protein